MRQSRSGEGGFSLIEILVSIVVVAVGLLGLAGLQTKMINAEMEAYQRSHALVLLQDMVDRLKANRPAALDGGYDDALAGIAANEVGCGAAAVGTAAFDICAWSQALRGAAATQGTDAVGTMVGARGCIESLGGTPPRFRVSVAWQGLHATVAPGFACGQGAYGDEALRRVVAVELILPTLD